MRDIFNILAGDIAQQIRDRVQASAKDVAMLLAATLLLVCAFVVFMFAAYVFLLRFMEPLYAALIIGLLFVLASLLLLVALKTGAAHEEEDDDLDGPVDGRRRKPRAGEVDLGELEGLARKYIRDNAMQATFMSLLAGVVVGSSSDVRRTLTGALDAALAELRAKDNVERRRRR